MSNVALLWDTTLYHLTGKKAIAVPATVPDVLESKEIAERLIARFPRGATTLLIDSEQISAKRQENVIPKFQRAGTRTALRLQHPEIDSNATGWGAEKWINNSGKPATTVWIESNRALNEIEGYMRNLSRDLAHAYPLIPVAAAYLRKQSHGRAAVLLITGQPGAIVVSLSQTGQVTFHRHHTAPGGLPHLWPEVFATLTTFAPRQNVKTLDLYVLSESAATSPAAVWPEFATACAVLPARQNELGVLAKFANVGQQLDLIADFDRPTNLGPWLQAAAAIACVIAAWTFFAQQSEHSRLAGAYQKMEDEAKKVRESDEQKRQIEQELQSLTAAYGPGINFSDDGRAWKTLEALSSTKAPRLLPAGTVISALNIADDKCVVRFQMPYTPAKDQPAKAVALATGLMAAVPSINIPLPDGIKADAGGIVINAQFR